MNAPVTPTVSVYLGLNEQEHAAAERFYQANCASVPPLEEPQS